MYNFDDKRVLFKHFEGLLAATFTPLHQDGTLNLGVIPLYAEHLKADGVRGAFVCGSSGEGLLLDIAERKAIAEKWVALADDRFKIIVHVGSTSQKMAADLASHAASIGADAIGCIGPCCFQPRDPITLASYCSGIAAAAPDTPFYYYHIPSVSGVTLKMSEFIQEARKRIPNLAGIKFTDNDLMDMMECMKMEEGIYDILHGHDESLLAGMFLGAKAAIGTTYNFMAGKFNDMIAEFKQEHYSEAREKQEKINQIIAVMLSSGDAISCGKAMMKMIGIDCGPCRLPIVTLSESRQLLLERRLKKVGFFSATYKLF